LVVLWSSGVCGIVSFSFMFGGDLLFLLFEC